MENLVICHDIGIISAIKPAQAQAFRIADVHHQECLANVRVLSS